MATPFYRVNAAGRHVTTADWSLGPDRTQAWTDLTLWVVDRGRGRVETPQGHYRLETGDALVLRGGHAYRFQSDPRERIEHFFVHYDPLDHRGRAVTLDQVSISPVWRPLAGYAFVRAMLMRLISVGPDREAAAVWLAAVLQEIRSQDTRPQGDPTGRGWHQRLDELCAKIRQEPHRPWFVQVMARELACTPTHLARLFQHHIGQSPKQFVLRVRLDSARHLLRDSDLPVSAIADQLGYANVYFFSRQFREHEGVSPTAFRAGVTATAAD